MARQRKRHWILIAVPLIATAFALLWHVPTAGAEQETFTSRCAGGTVEAWASYQSGQSYFQGRGRVTVDFSFPEADEEQTVVVALVAISTGPNCSEVEVRIRTARVSGGGDAPNYESSPSAGQASFGGFGIYGDFELTRAAITARRLDGERLQIRTSNAETVVGGPDQALELVNTADGTTTCHNGGFYYGMDPNGNTWSSGCVTAAEAASYGWDLSHVSATPPDHDEVYAELSSGRPGWRYEQWVGGQKLRTIDCTLRRLNLGPDHREFACTMP